MKELDCSIIVRLQRVRVRVFCSLTPDWVEENVRSTINVCAAVSDLLRDRSASETLPDIPCWMG